MGWTYIPLSLFFSFFLSLSPTYSTGQYLVNAGELVDLVLPWEQRVKGGSLEDDAPGPPQVHGRAVLPTGEQAFRRTVPVVYMRKRGWVGRWVDGWKEEGRTSAC